MGPILGNKEYNVYRISYTLPIPEVAKTAKSYDWLRQVRATFVTKMYFQDS